MPQGARAYRGLYARTVRPCGRAGVVGLALSSALAIVGCGGSSGTETGDASPALQPSGASAQTLRYSCKSGRSDTIIVTLPDPRRLAEVLNPINVCEFDRGLLDVSLGVSCSEGAPEVVMQIAAVEGKLPPATAQTICG